MGGNGKMDYLEQAINVIINNGTAVGCLVYFMYYNSKQAEKTQQLLKSLEDSIQELTIIVKILKEEKDNEK